MLELSAFASLAQLGAGLALAIAVFVEPIAVRERRARERVSRALKALPHSTSENTQVRSNELWTAMMQVDAEAKTAHAASTAPLAMIMSGALINFTILLGATVAPDAELPLLWMWILLAVSIAPVLIGAGWLLALAYRKIHIPNV